jgi:rhamnulose-1-phosphate aldolase/alcohol dehydrogenase
MAWPLEELLQRSRRLGSDPRNTNYGGGNTSAKCMRRDPIGDAVPALLVKGSGGDLATLEPAGVAAMDLQQILRLRRRYRGEEHEDEMFEMLEHCTLGPGGPPPSIDTAMHALSPAEHVDHLHPDSVIAIAAAADGEQLTKECFQGDVAWLPWRRPGFELAVQINALQTANPDLRGVVLGGHGLTSWGGSSEECERNTLNLIARAGRFIEERGRPDPFGPVQSGYLALPAAERRRRAAILAPHIRGLVSRESWMIGHFIDTPVVIDFLAREAAPRLVELGTSCPDHFLRTKVKPLLLDLPATASVPEQVERLAQLHADYRTYYMDYYRRHAGPDSPPCRGADPAIVLVPGVGMLSFGRDKMTARVAGEYYVNAINVMAGAESVSKYSPINEAEKFGVEYWRLEQAKLERRPRRKPLAGKVGLVTGGASGIGLATARRLAEGGACVVVADRDRQGSENAAHELGGADTAAAVEMDVRSEEAVRAAVERACLEFGGLDIVVNNAGSSVSKPLAETDPVGDWDLLHDVLARGSFLVSRASSIVLAAQGLGGDIVYVVSKNAVLAGPANIAYSAAKADQAHQVRLLAAELGEVGVRVNGVNPDGVVAGSGIFAGEWGDRRAQHYGVSRDRLGEYYATRTLLRQEVLPEHVADAVYVLVSGLLPRTTGMHIPVDGGIPGAFPR